MTSCPGAAGGGGGGAAWAGAVCWEPAMAAAAAASSAASLASAARAASRASASQAAASMAATASASASASAGTPGGLTSSSPPSPKVPIAGPKRRGGRRKGCALRAAVGGANAPAAAGPESRRRRGASVGRPGGAMARIRGGGDWAVRDQVVLWGQKRERRMTDGRTDYAVSWYFCEILVRHIHTCSSETPGSAARNERLENNVRMG